MPCSNICGSAAAPSPGMNAPQRSARHHLDTSCIRHRPLASQVQPHNDQATLDPDLSASLNGKLSVNAPRTRFVSTRYTGIRRQRRPYQFRTNRRGRRGVGVLSLLCHHDDSFLRRPVSSTMSVRIGKMLKDIPNKVMTKRGLVPDRRVPPPDRLRLESSRCFEDRN